LLFFFRKGITAILCTIKGTLRILFFAMQDKSADNLGSVTNVPLMVHVPKMVHSGHADPAINTCINNGLWYHLDWAEVDEDGIRITGNSGR
jgi:hypothetical protein